MGNLIGSSSSTSSSTTNYNTDASVKFGIANESGQVVAGNGNTVITTDLGAIKAAFGFANSVSDKSFGFGKTAFKGALSAVENMASTALDASRSESSAFMSKSLDTVKVLGVAGAAIAAVYVLKAKK